MRRHTVAATALFFVSPFLFGACSMIIPTRAAAPPSRETPAVLGTAIIAPGSVVPAVTDAVRADRQSAISIAGAAAAAAPTQAAEIRSAVIREAPADAAAVTAVTNVKPPKPPAHAEIPRHERLVSIVEAAEFQDASKTADFSSDGLTRITSQIARTLAALGRSVRQLVGDIR